MVPPILLAVEDELPIVELLTTLSAPIGMQLVAAADGTQATELLKHHRPALITLDLVLPDVDGLLLLEQVRAMRELDDVPVIVITAITDSATIKRAYALGASDFVSKPFNVDLLDAKLKVFSRMRRLADEVRARERFLEDMIEHVSSGMLVCDAAGRVLRINTAGAGQLGIDARGAVGRPLGELAPGAEGLLQVEPGAQQRRATIRSQDREITLGFTTTALEDGGTVAVFRELSEVEVARREQEERSRHQALARAARSFAHEVRNPLSAIGAAAQVIARDYADEKVRLRMAKAIEGESARIAGLVREYVDHQMPGPPAGSVDVRALLEEVVEVNLLGTAGRDRVTWECGAKLPRVRADPARLKQVVLNLVLNAVAATEAGGTIAMNAALDGTGVVLTVKDTGHGIAAADLPRIFDESFTTRANGGGLGLPIARRIVEEHGGRLAVQSESGEGTTFTVWLPAD
jgi:two-component system, NtrC family, sensor histidine kinase HydH